ncbi:MAG: branched-chain amino acid ABC transporter permease [Burkholderiaceae bacterium]
MRRIISEDPPGSRALAVILLSILVGLGLAPLLFPGARSLDVAAKICVFIVLAASYDLLLGYTGIVSFAHTMFFGIGAYGVAIALSTFGPGFGALALGTALALLLSTVTALVIGLFSLRVRALFYTMMTLAVAAAFQTLASQLSELTGGEDGLSFKVPELLAPSHSYSESPILGVHLDGRLLSYYIIFVLAVLLFLLLLRIVNSPFGRVLKAIRENDFRAEALGYRTVVYRTVSNVLAAGFATLAGALLAIWLRYNGPETSLSFEIMVDLLLIVVIGGMGTLYGAVVGATLLILAQSYLQVIMKLAADSAGHVPFVGGLLGALFAPERWLLWLGVLFVLSIYFFPQGIVGRLRQGRI